ncbi:MULTISPECIES: TetR/AcrR family transcriptional regulator [unclassified Oleiphilus]|jgi:AcrR family transcriptional regulator|uniref:TetR/AcrR family transcriptional regulator n=3 Tax=Oleiphilus TaxID=141450 RepID=UPI0007C360BF|nr:MULTISPECIES: TetR/AcrR family transcriptional regulator [unclassified Oleiphilus]KZY44665.1 TetR family transcriptional regulator [Oleiphilus sp. HI0050]KZY75930.1 TetR family transcriptional regulator [Oleiphilus sp. HI0068]KZY81756.1 TetR family transcriptional regulator [Oleiphilus sp. HI0069]KZY87664.1 TetR family transcriptional regulator [Oleiphilus sp. HI0072]KZZ19774.1 TetR family transcriptional regulator [Oleiphilus sp. HI0081]KZZ31063.1 TetR family transcriptional regulator [Ol
MNGKELIKEGLMTDPKSAKGRLLIEAARLFRVKGYERTTVRDLAAAVGIQSGSIFHHFKTKEEILKAVMEEVIIYNTHLMRTKLAAASSAKEEVLALITCEIEAITGVTGDAMSVLVYEWRSLNEGNQRDILKLRDEYEQLWLGALDKAKAEGQIKADTFILRRFLTGALSWTTTWYKRDGEISIEDLAEQALLLAIK